MILDKTLILTLQDFRRHFDFGQFWARRHNFVRDMSPDNVLYSSEDEKKLYSIICEWIKSEDGDAVNNHRRKGIEALCSLIGRTIEEDEIHRGMKLLDITAQIISVESGTDSVKLPGGGELPEPSESEILHKIEITGDKDGETAIYIGTSEVAKLKKRECIYVTDLNGKYIRVLPNKESRGGFHLSFENVPGRFESKLNVIFTAFGSEYKSIDNVTQFRYTTNYFEYTNSNKLNDYGKL